MALLASVLTGGNNNHETTSEDVNAWATDFVEEGVVGTISNTTGVAPMTGGFAVNAQGTPDMTVAVSTGVAYVQVTPSSQNAQTLRAKNTASANVTISANSSGSTKYDWIYITANATNANNPNTAGDNVFTLTTSRSSSSSSDDGTPPTYGYAIAVVTVANGAASITNGNIRDERAQTFPAAAATESSASSWSSLGATPSSVTYNGNRNYSLIFTGDDLTDTISAGMRFRSTRTVATPTRSTSLNGTTQYYSKSSPTGVTFTDDAVAGAWVKLTGYGTAATIISRFNGTSGWTLDINASGQVEFFGFNAASGNNSGVRSYQSIPLNRWVHIAAQLDMSAFSASSTTSYVMIDGVDVPVAVARAGTNPTALVQAGNLEVGSRNGGTQFFPGKLAQVFVSSAKITQANVRTLISQGLTAALVASNSIVSAFSFDNAITDLNTTNANNLTANGSAVATNADSPFGNQADGTISSTLDYGIIQSVSFSSNTTMVVQVPEGCAIPTSGGITATAYSGLDMPYNFLSEFNRYTVTAIYRNDVSASFGANNTWTINSNAKIVAPAGAWIPGYDGTFREDSTVSGIRSLYIALAKSGDLANGTFAYELTGRLFVPSATSVIGTLTRKLHNPFIITSATDYNIYGQIDSSSGSETFAVGGGQGTVVLYFENAYA